MIWNVNVIVFLTLRRATESVHLTLSLVYLTWSVFIDERKRQRYKGAFRPCARNTSVVWSRWSVGVVSWSPNLELFLLQFHSCCAGRARLYPRRSVVFASLFHSDPLHPHETSAVIMSLNNANRVANTMSRRAGSRSDLSQTGANPYARAEAVAQRGSNEYSQSFSRGSMTAGQVWVNTCCCAEHVFKHHIDTASAIFIYRVKREVKSCV